MREKSNIVVQKYTDCIELNGLNEECEEARDEIEVQVGDDEEENDYIKIYEKNENNSPHENEEDEAGVKIDCVTIDLIFIYFLACQ